MDKLDEILAKLAEIEAKIDELLGGKTEEATEEEQAATYDRLVAEHAKLTQVRDRLRSQRDRKAETARLTAEAEEAKKVAAADAEKAKRKAKPGEHRLTDAAPPAVEAPAPKIPATARRFGSLRCFRGCRDGRPAEERAYRFGMWAMARLATQLPHRYGHLQGTQDWVTKHVAAVGSNDISGYSNLIHPEFSMDIIDLREQYGVARRLLNLVPMLSDTKTVPRREGGLTAYPVGENTAGTESNKTWDEVMLTARKWMAISRASKEVDADLAISWGDDLAGEIAYAFAEKEDDCAFNGDGTSTYHGIRGVRTRLQDVDGVGTDSFGLVTGTGNAWSELTLNDHIGVVAKLPQYADTPTAVWVCHKAYYHNVMQKLELAAGGVTSLEIGAGDRRPRPVFLGYPVEFSQKFPATEANSSVTCVLGDLKRAAMLGDRQAVEIEFSDQAYVNGQSLWERDQIAIKGTERMDVVVHDVGSSSAAGPVVGLQTAAS